MMMKSTSVTVEMPNSLVYTSSSDYETNGNSVLLEAKRKSKSPPMQTLICSYCNISICSCHRNDNKNYYLDMIFKRRKRKAACRCKVAAIQSSLDNLLVKYSIAISDEDAPASICGGGVQQLLNNQSNMDLLSRNIFLTKSTAVIFCQNCLNLMNQDLHITLLPRDVLLHIFSFLSAKDVCYISRVCKLWFSFCNDQWFWRKKLNADMYQWKIINHLTNPDMYSECASDLYSKDIYLRCCPEITYDQRAATGLLNLSSFIRSFLPKSPPRVAMFGPGLESKTKNLTQQLLLDNNTFRVTGFIPGIEGIEGIEGLGAAIFFKLKNKLDFHLSILYSMSKEKRENLTTQQRLKGNCMLDHQTEKDVSEDKTIQISPSMQELCRLQGGFAFVVNVDLKTGDDLDIAREELFAMVNERWSTARVPLIVLACVKQSHDKAVTTLDIVRKLKLRSLNRPWQVTSCVIETMENVCDAFEWLIEQSHTRQ